MAKATYIGVDTTARKVKKAYIGVGGVARQIKKAYIGVNGVAKQVYSSEIVLPLYTGSYSTAIIGKYQYMYLTDSGTLTIKEKTEYDLFVVGGGGNEIGRAHV